MVLCTVLALVSAAPVEEVDRGTDLNSTLDSLSCTAANHDSYETGKHVPCWSVDRLDFQHLLGRCRPWPSAEVSRTYSYAWIEPVSAALD
jgi:hypothetical protein